MGTELTYNQVFWETLDGEALGAFSPRLTLGASGHLVAVEDLLADEEVKASLQLAARRRRQRYAQIPEGIESDASVAAGGALQRAFKLTNKEVAYQRILVPRIPLPGQVRFLIVTAVGHKFIA